MSMKAQLITATLFTSFTGVLSAADPMLLNLIMPDAKVVAALKGSRILAFAGIGDPAKFFATLGQSGLAVVQARSFADHHRYSWREAKALCEEADRDDLTLVTTEKDLVRLRGEGALSELLGRSRALPVALTFDDETEFRAFLLGRLAAARRTEG